MFHLFLICYFTGHNISVPEDGMESSQFLILSEFEISLKFEVL